MLVSDLGRVDYEVALRFQLQIVERKASGLCEDVVLLLEHPPTITLGVRGNARDLLIPAEELAGRGIALLTADRGGQATYHGPGQLICYPIVDLRARRLSASQYVRLLEESVVRSVCALGVKGVRQPGKAGVWTGDKDKIASVGVRIRNRVAYHGFSLNVGLTMDPCGLLVSCGMPETRIVSLNDILEKPVSMKEAKEAIIGSLGEVFKATLVEAPPERVLGAGLSELVHQCSR